MKLTQEQKEHQARSIATNPELMRDTEVAVYTMIGGGLLGAFAVDQPADFYIDSRVGRFPYPKKAILQAVEILALAHQVAGVEGRTAVHLLNLGVF